MNRRKHNLFATDNEKQNFEINVFYQIFFLESFEISISFENCWLFVRTIENSISFSIEIDNCEIFFFEMWKNFVSFLIEINNCERFSIIRKNFVFFFDRNWKLRSFFFSFDRLKIQFHFRSKLTTADNSSLRSTKISFHFRTNSKIAFVSVFWNEFLF